MSGLRFELDERTAAANANHGVSFDEAKSISEQVDIPYQSLINLSLRDCAASH